MDDLTFKILNKLSLKNVELITNKEFETPNLLRVKKERTVAEYSWTCTANLCKYVLENKGVDSVTYLDADMKFYSDPQPIFEEIGNNSIAIIEHRFSKNRKYLEKAGKFNVSWVYFKNDDEGLRAVSWWADKVLEWCHNRYEDGKFGDQGYLDDWLERFRNVKIIKTEGAGIAPWNVDRYDFSARDSKIFVNNEPLIFYHFHGLRISKNGQYIATTYFYLSRSVLKLLYNLYLKDIIKAVKVVNTIENGFDYGFKELSIVKRAKQFLFRSKYFDYLFHLINQWRQ